MLSNDGCSTGRVLQLESHGEAECCAASDSVGERVLPNLEMAGPLILE